MIGSTDKRGLVLALKQVLIYTPLTYQSTASVGSHTFMYVLAFIRTGARSHSRMSS